MKTRAAATRKTTAAKKTPTRVTKQVIGLRVKITLDETRGKEKLILETPAGQKITLSDTLGAIEITDGHGNKIKLDPAGVNILAAARVTVNATEVKLNTSTLVVDAGTAKFNGLVQCDTLIANSVVSASYTPGAGNIL